jgi:hypothetical protein
VFQIWSQTKTYMPVAHAITLTRAARLPSSADVVGGTITEEQLQAFALHPAVRMGMQAERADLNSNEKEPTLRTPMRAMFDLEALKPGLLASFVELGQRAVDAGVLSRAYVDEPDLFADDGIFAQGGVFARNLIQAAGLQFFASERMPQTTPAFFATFRAAGMANDAHARKELSQNLLRYLFGEVDSSYTDAVTRKVVKTHLPAQGTRRNALRVIDALEQAGVEKDGRACAQFLADLLPVVLPQLPKARVENILEFLRVLEDHQLDSPVTEQHLEDVQNRFPGEPDDVVNPEASKPENFTPTWFAAIQATVRQRQMTQTIAHARRGGVTPSTTPTRRRKMGV